MCILLCNEHQHITGKYLLQQNLVYSATVKLLSLFIHLKLNFTQQRTDIFPHIYFLKTHEKNNSLG